METVKLFKVERLGAREVPALRERLRDLMEQEQVFRRDDLDASGLADMLGISRHQLTELIRFCHGTNFYGLLNRLRITAACDLLLREPGLNILTVAFDVGFSSKSAFNREFRTRMNRTPSQYRRHGLDNAMAQAG